MTSGTSISFTRDPATDKSSSFILRCVVLCIQTFFNIRLPGYSNYDNIGRKLFITTRMAKGKQLEITIKRFYEGIIIAIDIFCTFFLVPVIIAIT